MPYRLDLTDDVPSAVRRVASEQIDDAARRLTEEHGSDPVGSVHEVRKDLKKARSLLRLVRPTLGSKAFRRENRRLRDIARSLSASRDADVLVETVEKLSERYAGRLPKKAFADVRRPLAAEARAARKQAKQAIGEEIVDALTEARAGVADWDLDGADLGTLRAGAVREYQRGRTAFIAAGDDPTVGKLHEFRKRAKDRWYHLRLLEDAWPGPLKAEADEAHALSDRLGDDHDVAVLVVRLVQEDTTATKAPVDLEAFLGLCAERREELQTEAFALGARLYAERPKPFGRRLDRVLHAARDEVATAPG